LTYYLGIDRDWGYLFVLFAALVVVMDLALRRTRWGRHVFAVGGNEEAARRSGINVRGIYVSVFALCSTFAALGGILIAGQLTSVSQSSGTTDTNLTAIAAAVIGGTSLFGGRGSAWAALLGIIVLQSIQSGLNLMKVDSSVRFIVTGLVLRSRWPSTRSPARPGRPPAEARDRRPVSSLQPTGHVLGLEASVRSSDWRLERVRDRRLEDLTGRPRGPDWSAPRT
jgi:ABC-type uncharacterized transport system permease subunit